MTDPRPAPYPADTRAKGWRFGLDVDRIRLLDGWALAGNGVACGYILMMFLEAWRQFPCGSLPNDDLQIGSLIGVKPREFARHRHSLMRDWYLASDGRLYHPVIADQVLEMIASRSRGWLVHREAVIARCGHRCWYCGCDGVDLTLDHVMPRSRGGADDPENLVPACRPCNSSKGARTPEEWRGRF